MSSAPFTLERPGEAAAQRRGTSQRAMPIRALALLVTVEFDRLAAHVALLLERLTPHVEPALYLVEQGLVERNGGLPHFLRFEEVSAQTDEQFLAFTELLFLAIDVPCLLSLKVAHLQYESGFFSPGSLQPANNY